jgi:hypothetical protein
MMQSSWPIWDTDSDTSSTPLWSISCHRPPQDASSHGSFCPLFSHVDHNRLGKTILRTHPIRVPKELQEPQTSLQHRRAIPQPTLDGLPKSHVFARNRQHSCACDPFAQRLSVAKVIGQSPIENHHSDVSHFVKVPDEVNVRLTKKKAPPQEFKREPDDHSNQQVDAVSEQPLPEGCQ